MLDFYSYYMQPMCKEIGLTLEQFWDEEPELYFAYLDAYNGRKKQEMQYDNFKAYLQGTYVLLALNQVLQFSKSPKKIYPDKPFELNIEPKKEKSEQEINDLFVAYMRSKKIGRS